MPKVFATWVMTLRPGTEEEFERFIQEQGPSTADPSSRQRLRILKGERGEGLGKYLMMNEFESVETRNRYFPSRTEASEEGKKAMQSEGMQKFLSFIKERQESDWVVLLEQQ